MTHDWTPPPPPPRRDGSMLTPAEVAAELRIDIRTVYALLRGGDLPCVNLGHRTKRIRRSVLDAYISARETSKCS